MTPISGVSVSAVPVSDWFDIPAGKSLIDNLNEN